MRNVATYFLFITIIMNISLHCMNQEDNHTNHQNTKVYLDNNKCPWNRLARVISFEEEEKKQIKSGIYREHTLLIYTPKPETNEK